MASNLDVVRGIYAGFAAGDIPAVLSALAPDVARISSRINRL